MKQNAFRKAYVGIVLAVVILAAGALGACSAGPKATNPQDSTQGSTQKDANSINATVLVDTSSVSDETTQTYPVTLEKGATIYDALKESGAVVGARSVSGSLYVYSIDSLAEKDHGPMSGWGYSLNGEMPSEACDKITVSDGDVVTWTYYK